LALPQGRIGAMAERGDDGMRIAKFREGQKVVGSGRNNKGIIATVINTNVHTPTRNDVMVKYYDNSGFLSFDSGPESTWEVIA